MQNVAACASRWSGGGAIGRRRTRISRDLPGRIRCNALLVRRGTGGSRCCAPSPPAILLSPFQGGGSKGADGAAWSGRITRRVIHPVPAPQNVAACASRWPGWGDRSRGTRISRALPGRIRCNALFVRRGTGGSRCCAPSPPAILLSPFQGEGEQGGGRAAWGGRHHSESDEYCTCAPGRSCLRQQVVWVG